MQNGAGNVVEDASLPLRKLCAFKGDAALEPVLLAVTIFVTRPGALGGLRSSVSFHARVRWPMPANTE